MKKLAYILGLTLLLSNLPVHADDFTPAVQDTVEISGDTSNTLTLDADNTGGDIVLQFGSTLGESLTWNSANLRFDLSDDLWVADGLTTGTDITVRGQGDVRLADSDSSNYVGLQAPTAVTSNLVWTLPAIDGTSGQVLSTNGTGTLSWSTPGGSGDITAVGSMTSGDAFANATSSGQWLGLGSSAGRLEFDDQTTDELNILAANVGIGTQTPATNVNIYENNTDTSPAFMIEQDDTGDASLRHLLTGGQNISIGIDNDDNDNYEISNTTTLTGTTYADANTMFRLHTESGSEGILDLNHQSRARAYRSGSTQSIPDSTWTKIQFNAENYDEKSEFDSTTNYRFTAKEDGFYQVNSRTRYTITAAAANNYLSIAIYVNGTAYAYGNNLAVGTSAGNTDIYSNNAPVVSDVVYLTAGQYIEIFTYQNSGAARVINQNTQETYVSIHKVS
jgi:hypothetical protein